MARANLKDGALYKLLESIFPEHRSPRDGVLDVARLSEELGLTTEGVYRWLRADKIPAGRARELVALANAGRRKPVAVFDQFIDFV